MFGTILTIALIGFVVWAILTYIPMPDLFKKLILVLVVIRRYRVADWAGWRFCLFVDYPRFL